MLTPYNNIILHVVNAQDPISTAHLLAASTRESGFWLTALPITSLGLRMADTTVRVAVGLRLGTIPCRPHSCHHCGAAVDLYMPLTASVAVSVRVAITVMLPSIT